MDAPTDPSVTPAWTLAACEQRVLQTIARAQRLPLERLASNCSFAELGIGSLDAINLVFVLEEEFGIVIPEEQMGFQTVGEVVEALHRHLNGLAPIPPRPPEGVAVVADRA